jgi:hypothetical protein
MQDVSLELESNILAADKLRGKYDRDGRKQKVEASTSNASTTSPQVDELTKLVQSLFAKMEKKEIRGETSQHEHIRFWKLKRTSEDKIMLPKLFKEIKGAYMIKRFRLLFKTIYLMMKKEKRRRLINKFTV